MDKLRRIMEIAKYKEVPRQEINDLSTTNYTIRLADGNLYGIVKEKSGYIIKKGLNESNLDYSEPMRSRKHYRSYADAMKKLNLVVSEVNRNEGNVFEVPLIGEQSKKKFILKTPKAPAAPEPVPGDDLPAPAPAMETPPAPEGGPAMPPAPEGEGMPPAPEGEGMPPAPEEGMPQEPVEGYQNIMDSIFTESRVENVLSKYFKIKPNEKPILEHKKKVDYLKQKLNIVEQKKDYRRMSETQKQTNTCDLLFEQYKNINFVGKTNKNNLVFQIGNKQIKVTPHGRVI
jgi:hypothetical protein